MDTKKILSSLLIVVLLIIVGVVAIYYFTGVKNKGNQKEIPIEKQFEDKIVYTTNLDYDKKLLKNDCDNRGGTFNECGSICDSDAAACAQVCAYTCEFEKGQNEDKQSNLKRSDWETYTDKDNDFTLNYPENWSVERITPPYGDIIRIKKNKDASLEDDELTGITHVSIYPKGLPTEGVFGQTVTSTRIASLNMKEDVLEKKFYVLESGIPWAGQVSFANAPDSWNGHGFIWGSANIKNLEIKCLRDGEVISEDECDPMTKDDQILRSGKVSEKDMNTIKEIVESFEFTSKTADKNSNVEKSIKIETPKEGQTVGNTFTLEGEALGNWFFEGEFSYVVLGEDDKVLKEGSVKTDENWMTEDFVSFSEEISFDSSDNETGTLALKKANPSGQPENAKEYSINLEFKK